MTDRAEASLKNLAAPEMDSPTSLKLAVERLHPLFPQLDEFLVTFVMPYLITCMHRRSNLTLSDSLHPHTTKSRQQEVTQFVNTLCAAEESEWKLALLLMKLQVAYSRR